MEKKKKKVLVVCKFLPIKAKIRKYKKMINAKAKELWLIAKRGRT